MSTAQGLGLGELAALWNRVYEGYFVPIVFSEEAMARHLRRAEVDLALSCVLQGEGGPCGLSLAARRGDRGYIAGFGIASEARRKGLGQRLIAEQLARLRDAGVREVQLEVIEQNPARALYRSAGFVEQRPLVLLEGTLGTASTEVSTGAASLAEAHAAAHGARRPTWRRELSTLQGCIAHEGAASLALPRACATWMDAGGKRVLLDAAAADDAAAQQLLAALAARFAGDELRLVDEDPATPFARAALARGWREGLRQVEMTLSLD